MNSVSSFAGATTSSYDMTSAVGPTNLSATASTGVPLAARAARVFFTTRYSTLASRSFLRSAVTVSTSRPLGSATMAARDLAILACSSAMTVSLSVRFKCTHHLPGRRR